MPRKISKRKAIQAEKRKAQAAEEARKNKRWPGTRRTVTIAHHNNMAVLGSLLVASAAVPIILKRG